MAALGQERLLHAHPTRQGEKGVQLSDVLRQPLIPSLAMADQIRDDVERMRHGGAGLAGIGEHERLLAVQQM